MTDLVKLARDSYKNKIAGNFSQADSNEVLKNAFIELNGGNAKITHKTLRSSKKDEMFSIIEEILQNTIVEGLPENSFFNQFVEYKNLALGDQNSFYIPDNSLFAVAETADGTTNVRRQRLNTGSNVSIATSLKTIKVYEELNRVLAGRVDFSDFIDRVGKSFMNKVQGDIYTAFTGAFASLPSAFAYSGSFSEQGLLDMIQHVEAATGKTAMLVGTKNALRKAVPTTVSETTKTTLNTTGLYGAFYGTPAMAIPQVHTVGTYNFMLSDADIYVVAGDTKPVKFVDESEAIVLNSEPMANSDLSVEYMFGQKYGTGVAITNIFGDYRIG